MWQFQINMREYLEINSKQNKISDFAVIILWGSSDLMCACTEVMAHSKYHYDYIID